MLPSKNDTYNTHDMLLPLLENSIYSTFVSVERTNSLSLQGYYCVTDPKFLYFLPRLTTLGTLCTETKVVVFTQVPGLVSEAFEKHWMTLVYSALPVDSDYIELQTLQNVWDNVFSSPQISPDYI